MVRRSAILSSGPAAANIVQKNSRQSVVGATPANMGQRRIGLQGVEALAAEWSAVFKLEDLFPIRSPVENSVNASKFPGY